jgi:hypothetical protein
MMYIFVRYGAFSFGTERNYIPEDFGKGSPTVFRHVAVRGSALVCCLYYIVNYEIIGILTNTFLCQLAG